MQLFCGANFRNVLVVIYQVYMISWIK